MKLFAFLPHSSANLGDTMTIYHRKYGWAKAFVTVLVAAFLLWLLDYGIHVKVHSDVSADIGRSHQENVHEENGANGLNVPKPRSKVKVDISDIVDNDVDDENRKSNTRFKLPDNPFVRKEGGITNNLIHSDKDIGFLRTADGKLVFAPETLGQHPLANEGENVPEVKPPRDPRKKKKQIVEADTEEDDDDDDDDNNVGDKKGQLVGLTDEEKEAKKTRQTLLDRLDKLYGEVKKAKGFDDNGDFYSHGGDPITECGPMTRPSKEDIEIQNEQWQVMDGLPHDAFLHTAYLDSRTAFDDTPSIRTMLVISGYYFHGRPHCLFWYNGRNTQVNVPTTTINRLSMLRKHFVNNIQYSMYMFSCTVPEGTEIPDEISMVMNPCESPNNLLTVVHPYIPSSTHPRRDFAVCVIGQWAQIGDVEAAFLTEWIEAYKLFGIGEINIYNVSLKVTPVVQDVIDHYTKEGVLNIIHQSAPVTTTDPDDEYDASQLCLRTSANDCMLRNVLRYKHIFVIDRDEIVVPRRHSTYNEMAEYWFKNLENFDTAPAVTIQNTFFYMDFDPDLTQPPYLATMRYRVRQPPDMPNPDHNYIPGKSMVNPQYCKIVWNHNCQIPMEPKTLAPMRTALLHHYRRGCMIASRKKDQGIKEHECEWIRYRESEDDYMLRFKDELNDRVQHNFKAIGANVTYLTKLIEDRL